MGSEMCIRDSLGPSRAEQFCRDASTELGVDVAIVDVNDLGRVKVLAQPRL